MRNFWTEDLMPTHEEMKEFVNEILGPISLYYVNLLENKLLNLGNEAKVLFCFRSGLRIYALVDAYIKSKYGKSVEEIFNNFDFLKISRLISAKLLYDINYDFFVKFVKFLYPYKTPNEIYYYLLGIPYGGYDSVSDIHTLFKQDITASQHLKEQSNLIFSYLKNKFSEAKKIILIDEGWSGTVHLPIQYTFQDKEIISLYFGKSKLIKIDNYTPANIHGLIFSAPEGKFIPDIPETAMIIHRHFIESFFEPSNIPTADKISHEDFNLNKEAIKNLIAKDLKEPKCYIDILFNLTLDYIRENAQKPLGEILIESRNAFEKLRDKILYPSIKDVKILKGKFRDHGLGMEGGIYPLLPPIKTSDNSEKIKRIEQALWHFGQITLEYLDNPKERLKLWQVFRRRVETKKKEEYFSEFLEGKKFQNPILDAKYNCDFKTAIITRTKDRAIFLERAAISVANQTNQNYDWIVVNDGGELKPVEEIINNSLVDPSRVLIVHHNKSKGMEAASNSGIRSSTSKFIVIHDDDDTWEPKFLEKTVSFLIKNSKKYKGVITKTWYVSEEVRGNQIIIHNKIPYQDWVDRVVLAEMLVSNFFPPIAFVFDREIYEKLGGFDESLPVLGDWDFNIRFLLHGDIGVIPEFLANYHHRDVGQDFRNSVLDAQRLHAEYNAILRNKYLRLASENTKYLPLAILFNTAYYQEDTRFRINSLKGGG